MNETEIKIHKDILKLAGQNKKWQRHARDAKTEPTRVHAQDMSHKLDGQIIAKQKNLCQHHVNKHKATPMHRKKPGPKPIRRKAYSTESCSCQH